MKLIVSTIESVEAWGEKLSLVKVVGIDKTVVANRKEDGEFRWKVGERVVYVPEGTVLPQDVLMLRGYWEKGAKKGMLGASKGNKVKNRTFGRVTAEDGTVTDPGVESSGLLFKVDPIHGFLSGWHYSVARIKADDTVVGDPGSDITTNFDRRPSDVHAFEAFEGEQTVVFKRVEIGEDVAEFFGATFPE
jgi:hypothetical protein